MPTQLIKRATDPLMPIETSVDCPLTLVTSQSENAAAGRADESEQSGQD
jgi:hypothetical protein